MIKFCEHEFICKALFTNKIECWKCGMLADDYYGRKFDDGEELNIFLLKRMLLI